MTLAPGDVAGLAGRAAEAAAALKLLANEQRLMLLCRISQGECPVGELVEFSGLPQSSVSQHLGRLREGGMVRTRREGTSIFYRLADANVSQLIGAVCAIYGRDKPPVA